MHRDPTEGAEVVVGVRHKTPDFMCCRLIADNSHKDDLYQLACSGEHKKDNMLKDMTHCLASTL
jgi:hypothetical protein